MAPSASIQPPVDGGLSVVLRSQRRPRSLETLITGRFVPLAVAATLLCGLLPGCGPSPDDPLPPESNLYVYSLAVAEKARLKVPELEALALYNIGQVHDRFGFENRAIEEYQKAIVEDRDLGAAYQRIGFILSQRGNRMEDAIEAYRQALRCEPNAVGVHARLALIYLHQGRLADAIEAIGIEHRRPEAASSDSYYCLGQAHSKRGETTEAIAAFREALRRQPDMLSAQYALAVELRRAGDTARSGEAFERFRSLKRSEGAAGDGRESAEASQARERRSAARTWFDAADLFRQAAARSASEGGSGTASSRRVELFSRELTNALEETVRLDPSYAEAWNAYFEVVRARDDLETALKIAARAAEGIPADGTWPFRGALVRIQLAQAGDAPAVRYREAVALLEEATRRSPAFAAAHFRFAHTVLTAMKSREGALVRQAVEHAARAVELDPDPAHYDILAFGHVLAGRADLARRSLEEGIRENPGATALKQRLAQLKSLESPR